MVISEILDPNGSSRQLGIREFKQITTAGATTAIVTKKVWSLAKFEV